jgi:hypothetical protein
VVPELRREELALLAEPQRVQASQLRALVLEVLPSAARSQCLRLPP